MRYVLIGVITAFLGMGPAAYAGTIQVTASGQSSAPADFVSLTVSVNSRCYKSSTEAKNANASLAQEIREVLKPIAERSEKAGIKDAFTEIGGEFTRQTETIFVEDNEAGNRREVLCENGWRTTKMLSAKLVDLDTLPESQDTVLLVVDEHSDQPRLKGPHSWANWSSPSPGLKPEHARELELAAIRDAKINAYAQLGVLTEECGLVNPVLKQVGPAGTGMYSPTPRLAAAEAVQRDLDDVRSSFEFGELSRSVTLTFTFEFDGGLVPNCPAPNNR